MSRSKIGGYMDSFLRVDMSELTTSKVTFDETTLRNYLGGTGIGIKILYEEAPPLIDWSDPENRLILASGPLGGTRIGGSGSFSVVTKGPLTNGATSVQANGFFGAYLKFCGYDGIIVQGASKDWIYLYIDEGTAEFRDANYLIGKDTYKTEDLIKSDLGKKEGAMSVVSIGPAGENLVKFAGIFADKGHSASHNGPGAVMGSKKLKAIAVARGKTRIKVQNREKLVDIAKKMLDNVKTHSRSTYDWGTLHAIQQGYKDSWLPIKNYTTNVWSIDEDKLATFKPEHIREYFEAKRHPCWACQLHHCHIFKIPEGPYAGEVVEEPEYEQLAAWGPGIGNTDLTSTVMLSKDVDRLGLDTNEAEWVIGLVMECYERGILTKEDTNGLEMTWGNAEAVRVMLNQIVRREGLGDVLAEGVMRAAKHIGGEAVNLAVHTQKGNTPRGHDHRSNLRWAEFFDTCVSDTGTVEEFAGALKGFESVNQWKELSTMVARKKGQRLLEDSMVTCTFNTMKNVELISQALSAVTGWDYTYEESIDFGRRIVNLLRAFNIRHGLTSDLDYPSPRYGSAPPNGPLKGVSITPYWDKMLHNYYKEMGWDEETGKPLPKTLKSLGLEHVINDIW